MWPNAKLSQVCKAELINCSFQSLGINERGFFTFGNQLNNGFEFQCESIINSKVAIHSGYTDGDSEHGEDYAKVSLTKKLWSEI